MAIKVSRILHAGYVFEVEGTRIAFDPVFESPFSRNCHAFPSVDFDYQVLSQVHFDAIFISHHHDDHCSFDSLKLLDRNTPIYMFCVHDEMFTWIKELGFKRVHPLVLNSTVNVGPFQIITHPALDIDVDSIFQVKVQDLNILNIVDSWIDPATLKNLENEKPWDLIMWPFQTMREIEVLEPVHALPSDKKVPLEWLEQIKALSPENLIPSSCQFKMEEWSWYNKAFFPISYKLFSEQVLEVSSKTHVFRLDPGCSVLVSKEGIHEAGRLFWVLPKGEEGLDYEYDPNIRIPSTSEIAKYLPALTAEQMRFVENFCRKGLLDRYAEVGPSGDLYFNKSRLWKLSVYDHAGAEFTYQYELKDDGMTLVEALTGSAEWKTEIIASKLYSALTTGESLSSLYVRVEKYVDVDVVEDPLLRCLFSGEFGSYQKAQLERIKKGASL
ncbi:MBL fold metallo-hydrolase [Bdellovibrio sp. SKB1291214]|uniref:MBL fold metallo-hydrolase n=1 Tax=Bdellovibrio sp. SKB1291214 TaxID=1732569 RepID=UPI000B515D95|nr:MBL fold metallo-hydrolase [Bdellovibrio sp. SKB1291214]UYL08553.1 MBL fold metallo-hydrolase [Bdellovibrio sp. SKB1291214]